jgi:hypothetical protein
MAATWSRLVAAWEAFQSESRRRWWLYPAVFVIGQVFDARLGELADTVVGKMNASGLSADIVRGLIGPLGLLAVAVLALLLHAYWDTRPSRSGSRIQISGVGTVSTVDSLRTRAPELEEQLSAERAKSTRLEAELTEARRLAAAQQSPSSRHRLIRQDLTFAGMADPFKRASCTCGWSGHPTEWEGHVKRAK